MVNNAACPNHRYANKLAHLNEFLDQHSSSLQAKQQSESLNKAKKSIFRQNTAQQLILQEMQEKGSKDADESGSSSSDGRRPSALMREVDPVPLPPKAPEPPAKTLSFRDPKARVLPSIRRDPR